MRSVRERKVETRDGTRLRVEERNEDGPGPPLLLLHGFTGSVEAWGEHLLHALATDRRLLAVDLPGHGGSDPPEEPGRYGLDRVLDGLEDVLDAAGISGAVWIGYSMGGRIALAAGALRPGRVHALVLESASPGLEDPAERRARRRSDEELARRIESAGEDLESFVDEWMALPLFDSQRRLPEGVLARERRRRAMADPVGLAATLRGVGTGSQPSFWDHLEDLEVPVLLLTGGLDRKFEAIAERMAALLPRARRCTVPDAGHAVHLERPREWLAAIRSMLEEGP